jgi:transposase-like protein
MTATCPVCGTETKQRVGVVIGGTWHYCWLCPKCGERWGWETEQAMRARAAQIAREVAIDLLEGETNQ